MPCNFYNPPLILANEIVIWHCVVWAVCGEETERVCNCLQRFFFSQEAYPSHNLVIAWEMRNAFSYIVIFPPKKMSLQMKMSLVSCGWGFVQEVNKHNTALICCLIKEGLKRNLDQIPKWVSVLLILLPWLFTNNYWSTMGILQVYVSYSQTPPPSLLIISSMNLITLISFLCLCLGIAAHSK